ncbi:hypothetical protein SXIM_29000 [Streptomyces xiamenensis]|uniref:Uncharacterized protein n=1 Tax=Streptomyces xiamenensis TaxID=408015 RepID=A0A0F7FWC1_9ACTN|nr:hypothetical protein SXIM_29000 [Streptomyces xiamenensis]
MPRHRRPTRPASRASHASIARSRIARSLIALAPRVVSTVTTSVAKDYRE